MPDERLDDTEYTRTRFDDALERELRREARVDPAARARLDAELRALATTRAAAPSARERARRHWLFRPHSFTVSPIGGLALAGAAALLVAVTLRRPEPQAPALPTAAADARRADSGSDIARTVSGGSGAEKEVQFVFVNAQAARVSLVGDFNNWDPRATPLRQSAGGVWSIVVPLAPGRHVYSFVVDGTEWVPDSTAARAPDSDFGGANSVVLVGGAT